MNEIRRFSISEASEQLGFDRRTLHRWIAQGSITVRETPGGQPYFLQSDLDELKAKLVSKGEEQ